MMHLCTKRENQSRKTPHWDKTWSKLRLQRAESITEKWKYKKIRIKIIKMIITCIYILPFQTPKDASQDRNNLRVATKSQREQVNTE